MLPARRGRARDRRRRPGAQLVGAICAQFCAIFETLPPLQGAPLITGELKNVKASGCRTSALTTAPATDELFIASQAVTFTKVDGTQNKCAAQLGVQFSARNYSAQFSANPRSAHRYEGQTTLKGQIFDVAVDNRVMSFTQNALSGEQPIVCDTEAYGIAPCVDAGGTADTGVPFTSAECAQFPVLPYCADAGVAAGCRLHCGLCAQPVVVTRLPPPPPRSPPAPPPCLNAGGTSTNGLVFTPEECRDFPKIPYCADDGVAAGCRLHCGFCTLPPGTEAQSPPAPSSPPLSPPAPPGESGILAGTVSLGVLIGAIAGSIGGCLLLTLCIVLLVVCCCCRKGKDGKRRTTLGTQARHQEYAVDVNGKTAV